MSARKMPARKMACDKLKKRIAENDSAPRLDPKKRHR